MKQCNASFRDGILLKCYDALEESGFVRFRKEGVDWPLTGGFHSWVGLNTGLYADCVAISPFTGIHVVPIARLCTVDGRKYDRAVATYAIAMGELPEAFDERGFTFTPTQSEQFIDAEVQRLAYLYASVGLGYARSIASYEKLLPLLRSRLGMLGGHPERVACCLYLMGEVEQAKEFTATFWKKKPEYFSAFAHPFLNMIKELEGAATS